MMALLMGVFLGCWITNFVSLITKIDTNNDDSDDSISAVSLSSNNATTTKDAQSKGWRAIKVFVGDGYRELPKQSPHSQTGQDQLVVDLFSGTQTQEATGRFFIDLAANDAVKLSNTLMLERDFGWKGLCIEPNPQYWDGLLHRKCDLVAAVIANETNELVQFTFSRGEYGGIVGEHLDNKPSKRNKQVAFRRTTTFWDVLQSGGQVPSTIDYLSLDVEGNLGEPFGVVSVDIHNEF